MCGGKPRIASKAISVQFIAGLYNNEWTAEPIAENYDLTFGEVYAALSYYFDHRHEIDRSAQEDKRSIVEIARPADDMLRELRERKRDE